MNFFEKLMTDFFDESRIIPQRLYDSGTYTLNQLIEFNTAGEYDTIIGELTTALNTLASDLGDVDQSLNIQKNKTRTNDEVLDLFRKTMKEKEGVIADKLGGFESDGFLEFYPNGLSEYTKTIKTKMPLLTKRVFDVAVTYATPLGVPLTDLLKSFKQMWKDSRDTQEQQMGKVKDERIDKGPSAKAVDGKLIKTIGILFTKYETNYAETSKYFDFSMLFTSSQSTTTEFSGTLAIEAKQMLLNKMLKASAKIKVKNTGDNATFIVYIVKHQVDEPIKSVEFIPGKDATLTAHNFGDLNNTFLMIKNLSDVNEAKYEVEVIE